MSSLTRTLIFPVLCLAITVSLASARTEPEGTLSGPSVPRASTGTLRDSLSIKLEYEQSKSPGFSIYGHRQVRRPKVALVLSGGGARGAAQIGVLKVLERHGIPVDFIAATSMGAIVGGLYASGYSVMEIERIALTTNWDEVLSLGEDTKRTDLYMDQKLARDRTLLAIRFQGFEPVIPIAVSSGQRLTDFLSKEMLQAPYHPYPDFDALKIPFRAIATDLVSGKRVVMSDGPLAEAIRASATTPLLYNPIERDTMRLIDGGLLANVPVDVAREYGMDIVLAVNTTSGLRTADEMRAPWQAVDQMMGISMAVLNDQQLKDADVVITPDIGKRLTYDLRGLDSVIMQGERSAEAKIPDILRLLDQRERWQELSADQMQEFPHPSVEITGGSLPDSLQKRIKHDASIGTLSEGQVRSHLRAIYELGNFRDVRADIVRDSLGSAIRYVLAPNPMLMSVEILGCSQIPAESLKTVFMPLIARPMNYQAGVYALEELIRKYRKQGYSLARIGSLQFSERTGQLQLVLDEGIITAITIEGGVRTQDAFVRKEFQVKEGEIFNIEKADRGVAAISSTTLFEFVYLEVSYPGGKPSLTIRLKERPSQLVRLGFRADNERHLQGLVDVRDENFQGSGMELGATASGGDRNSNFTIEYKAHRLFGTDMSFSTNAFYRTYNTYTYAFEPMTEENHWKRVPVGEYEDIRYGASVALGSQLERMGNAIAEFTVQDVRLKNIENAADLEERYRLVTVRAGTVVDSKDNYPFANTGIGLSMYYEFASEGLGSEVGYNALRVMWEGYTTWGTRHTLHPRITMGFADRTMPLSQQFRMGGRESFFGLREDDQRGRELLLLNLEYRLLLPFKLLFDTYWRVRYDLGSISEVPEEIKFSTFQHGVGTELVFRTPIGPASIGVGKSFFLSKNLPENPIQQGPFLFYFALGYDF
jgi:NTE family protein